MLETLGAKVEAKSKSPEEGQGKKTRARAKTNLAKETGRSPETGVTSAQCRRMAATLTGEYIAPREG